VKISIKIAILFAAVMLVLAPAALTIFAQPSSPRMGTERGHARLFVEPILIGHGFALNGDQYNILDLNAIKMSNVSPGYIRSLLLQNKNREEMENEIMNNTQITTEIRASLRFAGQAYALNITGYDNQSLTGDVLTLPPNGTNRTSFIPIAVGHISLSISTYEGDVLSTGTLTMNNTDYKVLLTSPMDLGDVKKR
jgi:hypothetical protein